MGLLGELSPEGWFCVAFVAYNCLYYGYYITTPKPWKPEYELRFTEHPANKHLKLVPTYLQVRGHKRGRWQEGVGLGGGGRACGGGRGARRRGARGCRERPP